MFNHAINATVKARIDKYKNDAKERFNEITSQLISQGDDDDGGYEGLLTAVLSRQTLSRFKDNKAVRPDHSLMTLDDIDLALLEIDENYTIRPDPISKKLIITENEKTNPDRQFGLSQDTLDRFFKLFEENGIDPYKLQNYKPSRLIIFDAVIFKSIGNKNVHMDEIKKAFYKKALTGELLRELEEKIKNEEIKIIDEYSKYLETQNAVEDAHTQIPVLSQEEFANTIFIDIFAKKFPDSMIGRLHQVVMELITQLYGDDQAVRARKFNAVSNTLATGFFQDLARIFPTATAAMVDETQLVRPKRTLTDFMYHRDEMDAEYRKLVQIAFQAYFNYTLDPVKFPLSHKMKQLIAEALSADEGIGKKSGLKLVSGKIKDSFTLHKNISVDEVEAILRDISQPGEHALYCVMPEAQKIEAYTNQTQANSIIYRAMSALIAKEMYSKGVQGPLDVLTQLIKVEDDTFALQNQWALAQLNGSTVQFTGDVAKEIVDSLYNPPKPDASRGDKIAKRKDVNMDEDVKMKEITYLRTSLRELLNNIKSTINNPTFKQTQIKDEWSRFVENMLDEVETLNEKKKLEDYFSLFVNANKLLSNDLLTWNVVSLKQKGTLNEILIKLYTLIGDIKNYRKYGDTKNARFVVPSTTIQTTVSTQRPILPPSSPSNFYTDCAQGRLTINGKKFGVKNPIKIDTIDKIFLLPFYDTEQPTSASEDSLTIKQTLESSGTFSYIAYWKVDNKVIKKSLLPEEIAKVHKQLKLKLGAWPERTVIMDDEKSIQGIKKIATLSESEMKTIIKKRVKKAISANEHAKGRTDKQIGQFVDHLETSYNKQPLQIMHKVLSAAKLPKAKGITTNSLNTKVNIDTTKSEAFLEYSQSIQFVSHQPQTLYVTNPLVSYHKLTVNNNGPAFELADVITADPIMIKVFEGKEISEDDIKRNLRPKPYKERFLDKLLTGIGVFFWIVAGAAIGAAAGFFAGGIGAIPGAIMGGLTAAATATGYLTLKDIDSIPQDNKGVSEEEKAFEPVRNGGKNKMEEIERVMFQALPEFNLKPHEKIPKMAKLRSEGRYAQIQFLKQFIKNKNEKDAFEYVSKYITEHKDQFENNTKVKNLLKNKENLQWDEILRSMLETVRVYNAALANPALVSLHKAAKHRPANTAQSMNDEEYGSGSDNEHEAKKEKKERSKQAIKGKYSQRENEHYYSGGEDDEPDSNEKFIKLVNNKVS